VSGLECTLPEQASGITFGMAHKFREFDLCLEFLCRERTCCKDRTVFVVWSCSDAVLDRVRLPCGPMVEKSICLEELATW
jgi:hypothetical protein